MTGVLKTIFALAGICLTCLVAIVPGAAQAFSPPDFSRSDMIVGPATVLNGDTLKIGDTRVLLYGVDAPEHGQTCQIYGRTWPCGERAKIWLAKYVGENPVRCLPRQGDPHDDRIGGVKAMCFNAETRNLSAAMLTDGLAVANLEDGDWFKLGNVAARVNRKGVWAGKFIMPHDWRAGKRLPVKRPKNNRDLKP